MLEFLIVPFLMVGVTNNAMGMRVGGKFIGGGGLAADKEANEVKIGKHSGRSFLFN